MNTETNREHASTCQWIGNTDTGYVRLQPTCCQPTVEGKSYCSEHVWRVYQEGTAVRRRKDARRAAAVWDLESAFNEAVEELVEEGFLEV